MAVLSAVTCSKQTKYKVASVSEDAASMSDGSEPKYVKVKHLTNFITRRRSASSCSITFCVVTTALVVSVTLNVVVSIYLWRHRGDKDTVTQPPYSEALVSAVHEDSVCTVCSSIGIRPESFNAIEYHDLSVHTTHEGSYLCCMHSAAALRRLILLFTDRFRPTLPPDKTSQHIPLTRQTTGVHLFVDSDSLKTLPPTLSWTKEYGFGSAYNSGDVIIDGNQLRIPRSGLYHVYSFVTFKTEQPRPRPDNVVHTINRKNKHLPELGSHVILIDKTTLPEVSERFMTSFLSATVRLRQDDQIFVDVSNLSYVYRFAPSNFFGLYFVGK